MNDYTSSGRAILVARVVDVSKSLNMLSIPLLFEWRMIQAVRFTNIWLAILDRHGDLLLGSGPDEGPFLAGQKLCGRDFDLAHYPALYRSGLPSNAAAEAARALGATELASDHAAHVALAALALRLGVRLKKNHVILGVRYRSDPVVDQAHAA